MTPAARFAGAGVEKGNPHLETDQHSQSASPCLLVQQPPRRQIVYLGANTGLCQNPSIRHSPRAKRWLGTVWHFALSRVEILLLSCNQEVSGQVGAHDRSSFGTRRC